jgi:1-deoxy-D-xylulose-5-phosphate reductoisomerase
MRTPIAYALAWPRRMSAPSPRLDLAALGRLTFEKPDDERFPALRLARAALQSGHGAPTILNAANETAVHAFLEREIGFLDIARTVERTLELMPPAGIASIEDVHAVDREARGMARSLIGRGIMARAV